jgi:rhodanese-related sulfurtransferase
MGFAMNYAGMIVLMLTMGCAPSGNNDAVMTPAQVDSLTSADSTVVLLDVRTEGEFNGSLGHLSGALLIPVQELGDRLEELEPYRDRTVVVYCRTGNRSHHATELLRSKGFLAFNMTGGMVQWNGEGRPAVRAEQK